MNLILSLLPIVLILVLMVGYRWGAARAGGAGYLSAFLIAVIFFGAGPQLLAYAHTRALILSLDVLFIIWAAFLLYRVVDEAGAILTISEALPHLTADKGMQALIIGWAFASFLQGVGGFGVPVAVIAPILVGLGFTPLAAVLIPSLGHGWAVTFGSLGSSFQALLAATGLSDDLLTAPASLFLGVSAVVVGFTVAHAAGGWAAVRKLLLPILLLGVAMGAVQYGIATHVAWNIAAFGGGLAGLVVGFPLARYYRGENNHNGRLDVRKLTIALSGYAILIVITLGIQLIPEIRDWLGKVVIQVQFPEVRTGLGYLTAAGASRKIVLFRHAGMSLVYTSILSYLLYWRAGCYQPGAVQRILSGMLRRVMSSSVSIVSMISMAVIMENAGMTDTLARGLATGMGALFPLVSPWIGGLGAFMTGSNTNSNVVFGALQMRTAELLKYSVAIILAAQTCGAGLASVMAPAKVVVGASTAGMAGREGEVMRKLVIYTAILLLVISALTLVGVWVTRGG